MRLPPAWLLVVLTAVALVVLVFVAVILPDLHGYGPHR